MYVSDGGVCVFLHTICIAYNYSTIHQCGGKYILRTPQEALSVQEGMQGKFIWYASSDVIHNCRVTKSSSFMQYEINTEWRRIHNSPPSSPHPPPPPHTQPSYIHVCNNIHDCQLKNDVRNSRK